jgi:hypothetical protein
MIGRQVTWLLRFNVYRAARGIMLPQIQPGGPDIDVPPLQNGMIFFSPFFFFFLLLDTS